MFEYSLTKPELRDAVRLQRRVIRRKMKPGLWRMLVVAFIVLAGVFAYVLTDALFHPDPVYTRAIAFTVLLATDSGMLVERYVILAMTARFARASRPFAQEPRRLAVGPAGLTMIAEHWQSELRWPHIEQVLRGKHVILFWLRGNAWMALPIRLLESTDGFLHSVEAWRAAA